ncbi:MAG TPA: spermidine/putrescine ABC transporter substrate-binding protein [Anaerolineales bacterium]|nr:spermidine/putrescine ABC transporter substrate-binding protein [Anaerolineales bacterium]
MKIKPLYILLILIIVLSACGQQTPMPETQAPQQAAPTPTEEPAMPETQAPEQTAEPPVQVSERCGDTSRLSDELNLYTWVEYIDPEIKDQFEAECGVKINETNFDSNETLLATLQAGSTGYDVIVPSDYMVQIMIQEGMLEELDFSVITNIDHMDANNVNQYFDPDQKYTVPYFWGTSGLAVDTNVISDPEDTWKIVFEPSPEVCGKISMLDDERETLGAALMYLGYGINDTDPGHLEEAKNLLVEQSECVKAYDSQTNDDLIVSGEVLIAHIWTGDAILAGDPESGGREGIVYLIPREGCTIWQDNLAIPVSAPNKYTAMVFINYLSDPEIAAQNAEWVGYGTPNEAAKDFIDREILEDEGIYPPDDIAERLQWIEDVGDALELYDRMWTEFKAAAGG